MWAAHSPPPLSFLTHCRSSVTCARVAFAVESLELYLRVQVNHWRGVAETEGQRLTARRQLQDARQHERDMGVRPGQPLPENGTCKHYSKSYRWLRFPCCGRAFPCDTCHDEQMDHPHEWANHPPLPTRLRTSRHSPQPFGCLAR